MTNRTLIKTFAAVAFAAFSTTASAVVYLRAGATGANNGTSWADAYTDAATAINAAAGQELRVAQGVYAVNDPIALQDGFNIVGGYKGEGSDADTRDVDAYQSILCGDHAQNNVWWRFTPNENQAAITTAATTEPVIKNGKFNDPVEALGYSGTYDGFFTKPNGTETVRCFTLGGDVGGTLDGLYIVGFGEENKSVPANGVAICWTSGPSNARTVVLKDLRICGCILSNSAIGQANYPKLTTQMTGCRLAYSGADFSGSNCRYLIGRFGSLGTIEDCTFESIVRNKCSANSVTFLYLESSANGAAGIDVEGCTFDRCATCAGSNSNYGGNMAVVGYGNSKRCMSKFCDSTIRNCYIGATGAGDFPLVGLAQNGGWTGSNVHSGLRIENNLQILNPAAGASYAMVGVGGSIGTAATRFAIENSVFKNNKIKVLSGAANSAVGLVGGSSAAGGQFNLVNCVFDNNEVSSAVAGVALSRGVICPDDGTGKGAFGLANCTFTGNAASGGYDILQWGAQGTDANVVNCTFDVADAITYNPFGVANGATSTLKLFSCSVKNCFVPSALGVKACDSSFAYDPIPMDGDYHPSARMPKIRETADVALNKAAYGTTGAGGSGKQYPNTYSFMPVGESVRQPLCPSILTGIDDKGDIGDLYGASRAASNTRGAVQALTAVAEAGCTVTVRLNPAELADTSVYGNSSAYYAVVPAGDPATVEAHPASGRYFARWENDGSLYSEDNPLTIPSLSSDLVLTAVLSETSQHRHSWSYSADGATLTATCGRSGCEDTPCVVSVTCAGKEYDGTPVAAAITNTETLASLTGATVGAIVYKQGDVVLDAAPSAVGSYTASATVTIVGTDYVLVAPFDIVPHVHSWSYVQNGSALTATCAGACADSPVTVSLSCTAENVYNEEPVTATLAGGDAFAAATGATVGAIVYKQGDVVLDAAPSEIGEYTANVTVTAGDDDYVLTVGFLITAHEHSWTYALNGAVLTATCTAGDCRLGSISVSLAGASTKFNDVAPGPYALTVDGLDAFTAATGATVGEPRYVLTASATELPSAPDEVGAYYVELSVTAGGEAYTLRKDFYIEETQTGVCLKAGATGAGTGIDWDNAYTDFSAAMAAAVARGLPLRVAQGVYIVTDTISLPDGFNVEGGYAGVQGSYDRDIDDFQTILCGDQAQNNVWWRFTPDENQAAITTAATTEPVIKNGKFNDPVAALGYSGDYDGFFTKENGTDTIRCFTLGGDVGGALDGLYFVGFGKDSNSTRADGAVVQWTSKPTNARTVVLKDLRVYGCMLSGPAFSQGIYDKLTTQMSGCRIAFSGADYTGGNVANIAGRICSLGYIRDCTFESLVKNTKSGNGAGFLRLESSANGAPGVDLVNCTFDRCATCTGTATLYGGTVGLISFGADGKFSFSKFSDCTIRNCYVGSTGAGDYPLVMLSNNRGWIGSMVNTGLRFENNLQFLQTAEGASYAMVGVGVGATGTADRGPALFSIENSVFKGNRIKVLSGVANSAVGLVGGNTSAGGRFTLVNCVFDGNTVQSSVAGIALSRGVISSASSTRPGAFGLANCTFRSSGAGYDVLQWGAQEANANVVNCAFDATDAQAYNPFGVANGASSTVRLFSCSVKNCLDPATLGVDDYDSAFAIDAIPLDDDYRPLVRMPKIRETAAVFTNELAKGTTGAGGAGSQYPNTYSFKPYGASARQALCASISDGTADKGVIGDLYGDSRAADKFTRGAVQRMDDLAESDEYAALVIRPRDVSVEGGVTTAGLSTATVSSEAMMVPKNGEATIQAFRDTTTKRVFAGWYNEDGSQYSPVNPLTLSELEDDLTLEARFMVRNGAAILFF